MALRTRVRASTIDEYLGALGDDKRTALEKLRRTIKGAAPGAEECISYQLPAFRLDGRMLVAFGATENHCAFYLMSDAIVPAHKRELGSYDTSKGTIRFQPDRPLPGVLVRRLVKARIAENAAMPTTKKKSAPARQARQDGPHSLNGQIESIIASLKKLASTRIRDDMVARYGIVLPDPSKALGVRMAAMQQVAKRIGRNHELALALWETGWYEARTVAAFLAEPARLTSAQMDRWCRDFDNWAIVDTVCFKLFDRVAPDLAFRKVERWSRRRQEFARRAAFALLASLALHDKESGDEPFARCLPLIERAAADDRNFVRKGVSWALRSIGRRSPSLRAVAVALAKRLAASTGDNAPAARWLGNDALRDLGRRG
jgi:3-methyladenine DNA glycosylase AlkD/uncharacterized protein YdhG (YjbR/CyaY superfamily)